MSENIHRNLGYYSNLQTELSNTFKSYIYTWVNNIDRMEKIYNNIKDIINIPFETFHDEYRTKIFLDKEFYYLGIIDLYILNIQHDIPIVMYDSYDTVFMIIDNGIKYNNLNYDVIDPYDNKYNENSLKIKYKCSKLTINTVPESLQVIY